MGKPTIDAVDAAIRGYDNRFDTPAISGRIVEYEGDRSEPTSVLATIAVTTPNDTFGLGVGDRVKVGTSVHPDDTNVLIADLEKGSDYRCAPGSLVEFEGCTKRLDEGVFEVSSFNVVEIVDYPRFAPADEPSTIPGRIPEIGEVITDFVVFSSAKREDMRVGGMYVVESVEARPDGYGHGKNDVYPGGMEITARRLGDDGRFDPVGNTVTTKMKAGGSYGNNTQFTVLGQMVKPAAPDMPTHVGSAPGFC